MGSRSTMMERTSTPSALAWVMAQRWSEGTKRDSVSCSPMRSMKWLIRGSGPSRSVRRVKPASSSAEEGACARDMLALVLSPASQTSRPCRVPLPSASSTPARRSAASAPRSPRSSTCARARCTSARRCAVGRLAAAPRTRSRGTRPYYEWGHLKGGKLVHRVITPEQAHLLQQAIDNQRHVKKLMRAWEEQTERLIDLEAPRLPYSAVQNIGDRRCTEE